MEFKDYVNVVINRKFVIIGAIVLVAAAAMIFSLLQAPMYESRVHILIDFSQAVQSASGIASSTTVSDTDLFVLTQAEIIGTKATAQAVSDHLQSNYEELANQQIDGSEGFIPASIPSPEDLMRSTRVKRVQNTNVFEIAVSNGNPLLARDIAQAYGEVYIANRQESTTQQIEEARNEIWNQIQEAQAKIDSLNQQMQQYTNVNKSVPSELATQSQQAVTQQSNLYDRYYNLGLSEALQQQGLQIIEPTEAGNKVSPNVTRNIIFGALIGIIMGFALAFLVNYVDNTLKTKEDFEKYYGAPVIGEIAQIEIPNGKTSKIVYFGKPESSTAEGYRTLRTNLQFMNIEGTMRVVMITSAGPDEGKVSVAVNLAAAISEMGDKVVVVEADLRRPALEMFVENRPAKGLTDVILGTSSVYEAVVRAEHKNLGVMMSGPKPPNPAELVASMAMNSLLENLQKSCDYVFVDAPPVLAASDAVAMAAMMDGVILVAMPGKANREGARRTVERLRKVDARILGLVINIEAGSRYDLGDYHYYSYGEGSEKRSRRHWLRRKKQNA